MQLSVWLAFCVAAVLISVSPGAGAVFVMTTGARHGYRRSIAGIAGMQLGIALQLLVVAVGLGAVLATSSTAFAAVKWFGVAYLLWFGWEQFRADSGPVALGHGSAAASGRRLFVQGFLVNASNPKATVFLLAVLPQFIDPLRALVPQYAATIATLTAVDLVVMSAYAVFAAKVLRLLREPHHIRWLNRAFGSLFMLAGGLLATFKRAG